MRLPISLGTALAVLLAGCGAGPGDATTVNPSDETVEITGADYAYEGVPGSVSAGTELTFTNDSDGEVHEIVLVDLHDDEERPVSELAGLGREEQLQYVAEHSTAVSIAPPGEEGELIRGDLMMDEPGRYALLCVIPTGADPDEFMEKLPESDGPPDVEGG